MNQVKVGWHRQVAGKLMIRLDADRTDRDIRATTQQVKQPHTELTCKTFVNDLQRLQTFTYHATLGIGIVRTNIIVAGETRLRVVTLIAVAVKQRVDFCLRKNTVAHVVTAE